MVEINKKSKNLREGSLQKRTDILKAARDLFLTEGYHRTSVDAVASKANVSKRTIYDYYGNKRALFLAVIDEAGELLMNSIQHAIDRNLTDVRDLEQALISFSEQVVTSTFASSDYAILIRLGTMEAGNIPELAYNETNSVPHDALAKQFITLEHKGLLNLPDPRLATEHFFALTFLLAFSKLWPSYIEDSTMIKRTVVDGVQAFLRIYGS